MEDTHLGKNGQPFVRLTIYEEDEPKAQRLIAFNSGLNQWEDTDSVVGLRDAATGSSAAVFKDSDGLDDRNLVDDLITQEISVRDLADDVSKYFDFTPPPSDTELEELE